MYIPKNSKSIGIDGCRGGWCVAFYYEGNISVQLISDIESVFEYISSDSFVFIDMPINLTDRDTGRTCEAEARKQLPAPYKSTIFPSPCLSAVYASSYEQANLFHREKTRKGLSIQSWNLCTKIKELDIALNHTSKRDCFYESHPELSFAALNDNIFPPHKKKTSEGQKQRIEIIATYLDSTSPIDDFLKATKRKDIALNDILDSICLAIAASFAPSKQLKVFSGGGEKNENNQVMKITIPCVEQGEDSKDENN